MALLSKWRSWYRSLAILSFNTILLFLLLNVAIVVITSLRDYIIHSNPVSIKYGLDKLEVVYPELSTEEINLLLRETWSRPYLYAPYIQFKERPYSGRFVNVDANGFRRTKNQGAWPPDPSRFNIFLFGGSTLFGYGVPDDQTIASHLQVFLTNNVSENTRVYNFGQGYYYSTQERILFEQFLASGHVPALAIFIDGLNDFYYNIDEPYLTPHLKKLDSSSFISYLPIADFSRRLSIFLRSELKSDEQFDDQKVINRVINRYLANKKMIEAVSNSFGCQPIFVWQPIPTYKYDLAFHLFSGIRSRRHNHSKYGYRAMEERVRTTPLGENFFWCADMQMNLADPLYVDSVHYSGTFSQLFACEIGQMLIDRKLVRQND